MVGKPATQAMWLGATAAVVVSNLFGLPYPGWYDNVLILVSFVFNALIAWYAWAWLSAGA